MNIGVSSTVRPRGAMAVLAACALAAAASAAAAEGRPGRVEFSDGSAIEGALSFTPGRELTIHDGKGPRSIEPSLIIEIRLQPEQEELVRKWRFLEAGQAVKQEAGKPYPLRHLAASVWLAGGERVDGHLFTAPLYVEATNGVRKVVLLSKQRGEEGQPLEALVYPVRVSIVDPVAARPAELLVRVPDLRGQPPGRAEFCALTRGALVRLPGRWDAKAGAHRIASPFGAAVFAAVRAGDGIAVGWPDSTSSGAVERVAAALADVRDFFDRRELLRAWQDPAAPDIYALMLLERKGATTLDGERTQPWRLEVWRWRRDEEGSRLMLAGRGFFFRGIGGADETPPHVTTTPALWEPSCTDSELVFGAASP